MSEAPDTLPEMHHYTDILTSIMFPKDKLITELNGGERESDNTCVEAFSDSDWASKSFSGQLKSTSSGIIYVNGILVFSFF